MSKEDGESHDPSGLQTKDFLGLGRAGDSMRYVLRRTSEVARTGLGKVQESPEYALRQLRAIAETERIKDVTAVVAHNLSPKELEKRAIASRENRLALDEENRHRGNRLQRFFRTKPGWWVKTALESTPSHLIYGPGDLITLVDAGFGKDFLNGNKLDTTDRWIYALASGFPWVPSTVLIPIFRRGRKHSEDTVYHRSQGNTGDLGKSALGVGAVIKEAAHLIKSLRRH